MGRYAIVEINRENLAWAGGFYSGEGSCYPHRASRKSKNRLAHIELNVTNTNLEALNQFYDCIGRIGRVQQFASDRKRKPTEKPYWRWRATKFSDVMVCIGLLWNFISREKKDQITRVVRLYRSERSMK